MYFSDVEGIPELNPPVEEIIMDCLKKKVVVYAKIVHGKKYLLCPFRKVSRERYMKAHCILYNVHFFYPFETHLQSHLF